MTTKVFVGNLDFQTTDQALADAFVDCGKVKSGVIITRGRRSLGYGFVEFESADSAEKAVETKNGTELSKRQIKVELVRDPADRPAREPRKEGASDQKQDSDKGQGQEGRRNNNNNNRQTRPGFRNRRRAFARRTEGGTSQGRENNNNNTGGGNNNTKSGNSNTSSGDKQNNNNNNNTQKPKRTRRRNTSRQDSNQPQNPPKEKILSKTAIFVANIPFEAKDEDLKNYFKESNPKSAHVVTTQTGRSRGYGFVDFDNEKDQQHAIQTKNKAKWTSNTPEKGDREISVSASHSQPKEETAQSSQKE